MSTPQLSFWTARLLQQCAWRRKTTKSTQGTYYVRILPPSRLTAGIALLVLLLLVSAGVCRSSSVASITPNVLRMVAR